MPCESTFAMFSLRNRKHKNGHQTKVQPKPTLDQRKMSSLSKEPSTTSVQSLGRVATAGDDNRVKGPAMVFLICGASNSGKTTTAKKLVNMLQAEGATATLIKQDSYYLPPNRVERVVRSPAGDEFYYNYDSITAINIQQLEKRILEATHETSYVVVEGGFLTEEPRVMRFVDRLLFLTIDQKTCRRRRSVKEYDPPDIDGYFDEIVWPSYVLIRKNAMEAAREDKRFVFIDMSSDCDVVCPQSIVDLLQSFHDDLVRITFDQLDVEEAMRMIRSPVCGATSVFVGTTRDSFNGLEVVRLDYESYDEMAYKEMRQLCAEVRQRFTTIERIVFWHRIGEVPVEEASVIVAAASPHREEALQAVEMGINEIKRRVPIWKKEVYADGGCAWKENGEWRTMKEPQEPATTAERAFAVASRNRDKNPKILWLQNMVRQLGNQQQSRTGVSLSEF